MALIVRIRTIFRLLLFFIAIKIIRDYNDREWGWLKQKYILDDYLEIRIYSVYMKDQEQLSDRVVGFVTFTDIGIGPHDEMYHTQHLRILIKRIGNKYRKIVVNPVGSKKLKAQTSLSSLFMRALVHENLVRSYEGLQKIEIYYYPT